MFGIRNTGLTFLAKVGNFSLEVACGMVEEITFNITDVAAANASELPENLNLKLISKDQFLTTTSAVVSSKILKINVVDLIYNATFNLL